MRSTALFIYKFSDLLPDVDSGLRDQTNIPTGQIKVQVSREIIRRTDSLPIKMSVTYPFVATG